MTMRLLKSYRIASIYLDSHSSKTVARLQAINDVVRYLLLHLAMATSGTTIGSENMAGTFMGSGELQVATPMTSSALRKIYGAL